VFVHGDIGDRALVDRPAGRAPAARRACTSRPRATSTAASTARAPSSRPTSRAPSRCWRPRARTGLRWRATSAAFRFHHVSTDEVYGSLGPDDPPFTETTRTSPTAPTAPARPPATTWCAPGTTPTACRCSPPTAATTTGRTTFPEKLIPLMIVNALAGKPLPVYGDGMQMRDWLYVGPLQRHPRGAGRRPPGRDLQRRRLEREAQHRDRAHRLRAARRAAARPDRPLRAADHLREGPPRPRPPLRHRRPQDRARTRLAPGRDLRDRHPQDRAVVPGPRRLGGQRAERRYRDWVSTNYAADA
jgi:nucleoside-diphosphate-sugar epimerase